MPRNQVAGSLGNTFVCPCLKVTANLRPIPVDSASHGISIQGNTPAIIQPGHSPAAPFINLNIRLRHAGIGNEHDFQATTAGFTIYTAHPGAKQSANFDTH
jgi:hypothetical protein